MRTYRPHQDRADCKRCGLERVSYNQNYSVRGQPVCFQCRLLASARYQAAGVPWSLQLSLNDIVRTVLSSLFKGSD